jgi:hypothetical protein
MGKNKEGPSDAAGPAPKKQKSLPFGHIKTIFAKNPHANKPELEIVASDVGVSYKKIKELHLEWRQIQAFLNLLDTPVCMLLPQTKKELRDKAKGDDSFAEFWYLVRQAVGQKQAMMMTGKPLAFSWTLWRDTLLHVSDTVPHPLQDVKSFMTNYLEKVPDCSKIISRLMDTFAKHNINTLETFINLTPDDLTKMGIITVGFHKAIQCAQQSLSWKVKDTLQQKQAELESLRNQNQAVLAVQRRHFEEQQHIWQQKELLAKHMLQKTQAELDALKQQIHPPSIVATRPATLDDFFRAINAVTLTEEQRKAALGLHNMLLERVITTMEMQELLQSQLGRVKFEEMEKITAFLTGFPLDKPSPTFESLATLPEDPNDCVIISPPATYRKNCGYCSEPLPADAVRGPNCKHYVLFHRKCLETHAGIKLNANFKCPALACSQNYTCDQLVVVNPNA